MRIKKGDIVKVIAGKDKGRQGKVIKVIASEMKVVVEGINMYKKHIKGDGKERESAIVDVVKPMNVSNVMLVCPSCGKLTRIGYKLTDGKKERICKKCNKAVSSVKSVNKEDKKVSDESSKKVASDKKGNESVEKKEINSKQSKKK